MGSLTCFFVLNSYKIFIIVKQEKEPSSVLGVLYIIRNNTGVLINQGFDRMRRVRLRRPERKVYRMVVILSKVFICAQA